MGNFSKLSVVVSIVLVIIIAGLGIINFTGVDLPFFGWLENGVFNIISPVVGFFNGLYNSVAAYWDGLMNVKQILKENDELKSEISLLERENLTLHRYERENIRLRELLAFKKFVPYQTLGAQVIGYSPSNWKNRIIIDRGARDGLKEKMPVISYNGTLVGRVDYVGATSSQVTLVSDPEFLVGGIVQRADSRAIGLVKGQLNNEKSNTMEKISWDANIKEGDLILTSGLSNSYPKGLPIGKVTKVETDDYGLSQKAEIELFFALKTTEEILVITDF